MEKIAHRIHEDRFGRGPLEWLGQLLGVSFVGTWWLVAYGQNTGLLLLGLAGFLHFTRAGNL